jgi:hypothetical protein
MTDAGGKTGWPALLNKAIGLVEGQRGQTEDLAI